MADPFWPFVKLLMHCDGATGTPPSWQVDASSAAHNLTSTAGSWGVEAGTGKFTDCVGRLSTTLASRGEIAHSADFVFDTDFCVEFWVKRAFNTGFGGIIGKWGTISSFLNQWGWIAYWDTTTLTILLSSDGTTVALTLTKAGLAADTWHYVAIARSGDTVRLFVNGVLAASGTFSGSTFNNTSAPLMFGAFNGGNSNTGNRLDEIRITKGRARYTTDADITVPSAPFEEGPLPDLRVTQATVYGLVEGDPQLRVTQAAVYALLGTTAPLRITQVAVYALVKDAPCITCRCRCVRLTRADGEVFAYTEHDQDVFELGTLFSSCGSISSSATESASTANAVGDTQFTGLFRIAGMTPEDVYAGKFDGAFVEVFECSWDRTLDDVAPRRLAAGTMGRLRQGETSFTGEALSPGALLQQRPLLETVVPHCRYELFSSRCSLDRNDFLVTGAATSVAAPNSYRQSSYRQFTDTGRAEAAPWFARGKVTWTSGRNAGVTSEVKDFADGVFTLWEPLPYPIQAGDAYEATPGCDLLKTTCKDKFDNLINWGGYDDLPGTDDITLAPIAKQGRPPGVFGGMI